ncbi:MAG TPA: lytic transglycosylase domain-containing protein [Pseudolabrys sp.]|nr:lytic transglycosylase domain-containing protein [Pseudolabrys sp.]
MRGPCSFLSPFSVVLLLLASGTGAGATSSQSSLCLMLESAARANDLPVAFLARIVWRESRFDPHAVGPATRGGAHAEGIAQFMASTASDRDLADPFDPVQALPKAAEYLRDLRDQFGNLGLAAAAYNAGPGRVRGWLDGVRTMPQETRRYVEAVSGRSVDEWAHAGRVAMVTPHTDCLKLLASLQQGPSRFFYELKNRVTAAIEKPWSVELAAGFSRSHVLAAYAHLMDKLSALVGAHDPIVTSTVLRSRGTRPLFQARIGVESREAANGICSKIKRAGAACLVLRMTSRR